MTGVPRGTGDPAEHLRMMISSTDDQKQGPNPNATLTHQRCQAGPEQGVAHLPELSQKVSPRNRNHGVHYEPEKYMGSVRQMWAD